MKEVVQVRPLRSLPMHDTLCVFSSCADENLGNMELSGSRFIMDRRTVSPALLLTCSPMKLRTG